MKKREWIENLNRRVDDNCIGLESVEARLFAIECRAPIGFTCNRCGISASHGTSDGNGMLCQVCWEHRLREQAEAQVAELRAGIKDRNDWTLRALTAETLLEKSDAEKAELREQLNEVTSTRDTHAYNLETIIALRDKALEERNGFKNDAEQLRILARTLDDRCSEFDQYKAALQEIDNSQGCNHTDKGEPEGTARCVIRSLRELEFERDEARRQLAEAQRRIDEEMQQTAAQTEFARATHAAKVAAEAELDECRPYAERYQNLLDYWDVQPNELHKFIKALKQSRDIAEAKVRDVEAQLANSHNHCVQLYGERDTEKARAGALQAEKQHDRANALQARIAGGVRVVKCKIERCWHEHTPDCEITAVALLIEPPSAHDVHEAALEASYGTTISSATSMDSIPSNAMRQPSPTGDELLHAGNVKEQVSFTRASEHPQDVDKVRSGERRREQVMHPRETFDKYLPELSRRKPDSDRRKVNYDTTVSSATSITSIGSTVGGGYCEGPERSLLDE